MNRIASLIVIMGSLLFLVLSCGPKKTKEQLLAEADQYKKEENFKEAITTYQQFVHDYPKANGADSILFQIGQIYSNNLADFASSIEAHKQLVEKYPNSKIRAQSLFMIGYHYANNVTDLEKARESYEMFLEKYSDHELSSSVKWELEHLGQDINEIEFLKTETLEQNEEETSTSNPQNTK